MKDASDIIRTWVYSKLQGITYNGKAVAVYSGIPVTTSVTPYIVIGEQSSPGEMYIKGVSAAEHDIVIEIWSHFKQNASYKAVNIIAGKVTQALRITPTTYIGGEDIDDWNTIRVTIGSLLTDKIIDDTGITVYKSISINFLMEEL